MPETKKFRRFGKPLTEKERRERHERLYPKTKLPPRGTGLKKKKKKTTPLEMMKGTVHAAVGMQALGIIARYS